MKYSKLIYVSLIIFILFQISCSSKGRYVGKSFNTSGWCKFDSETARCRKKDENLFIEATLQKTEVGGEYLLKGYVDMEGLRAYDLVVVGGDNFYLILAKDNIVVKTVPFSLSGSDINIKIPFTHKFKSPPFDSFIFSYELSVQS